MFDNEEEEEPFENNNNKYIMFSKDEKDIKLETTSCDNEMKNEHQNKIISDEFNEMIPSLPFKSNIDEKENQEKLKNINDSTDKNDKEIVQNNLISNDYDEVKMNIKNYLKDKIEKENIEATENKEKEKNNNSDSNQRKNLTETNINNEPNIKNNLTQVQITNSSLSKGLKNVVINSTKTSIESLGNSIDNYIKMENLYLQDGKINSTTTNYDISNTNNLTTNNNNINLKKSKNSYNKLNEMRKEKLLNKLKQNKEDEEEKEKEQEDILNNIYNKDENNEINLDNNDNHENIVDKNLNINYGDIISEFQQKLREERTHELKEKAKNKLRPKIYEEIYKKEYNNIVSQIYKELENQLKEELDKKMTDEFNYIKKKENFNQKIKMEQIDNDLKEKVKNEFEEELNKELIIKEKEIKIKYNQKLENFKKKFRNELEEEYEKKKKEMKNQLNDIKSKIYRSRCSEKIKITKINKMKKNIGNYNEKNNVGIKKIDKILGNDSDEEINNINEGNDNLIPFSLKNQYKNKDEEEEENEFINKEHNFFNNKDNFNFSNEEQKVYNNNFDYNYNNFKNINKKNSIKGKTGDNSVNLAELNKRIKESTDKISKNAFIEIEQLEENENVQLEYDQNEFNENINNFNNDIYNYPQEENDKINDDTAENNKNIKDLNKNLRGKTYNANINIKEKENNFKKQKINTNKVVYNKPKTQIKTNFDYTNNLNKNTNNYSILNKPQKKSIIKNNNDNNNFIFDKNKNIFYSIQISPNIPTNISDFGKFLISHIEKEDNYKILFFQELKSFKLKIKKIFSSSNSSDHCLTDYLLDIWEKIDVSFFIRYQILKNIIKLKVNDLYMFLDRETEYLTNYYQISEKIFENIKKRENMKAKLQLKNNRNEMILQVDRDKLDEVTQILEEDIKLFKEKYEGMNIVWKGIYYEWFMNYEKWFYEMEIRNDFEYLN